MKRHLFGLLLAMFLSVGLLPTVAAAENVSNVQYRNYDAENGTWIDTATCPSATVVTDTDLTWGDDGNDGWYVVNSHVTMPNRVVVNGDVHLILEDDCEFTVNGGIQVQGNWIIPNASSSSSLTIYAQSSESGMGKLTVPQLTTNDAAIGANGDNFPGYAYSGIITINGGNIDVSGNTGAGIGGGGKSAGSSGGIITINGGVVQASSSSGAGIGSGESSVTHSGIITINGGSVTASSGSADSGAIGGASGSTDTVTINGGTVKASVTGQYASGILVGPGGTISINGGVVEATASGSNGAGITNSEHQLLFNSGGAVVFASSIVNPGSKENWNGIFFEGDGGVIYGTSVTPSENFTIPAGKTLTIGAGQTLTIPAEKTLTNNGAIRNEGTILNYGTIVGTVSGNQPKTFVSATYLDDHGVGQPCTNATVVSSSDTTWNDGWYVVNSNVTIGTAEAKQRVVVDGDVHLILANNCTLTVNGGILVNNTNKLTIYAQSTDEGTMGKLVAQNASAGNAGIGGLGGDSAKRDCGTIAINGGYIQSGGANGGAGIGGGTSGFGGTITINGGKVEADSGTGNTAGGGTGIGGGSGSDGGNITVNGGIVSASASGGAGIGGGRGSTGGSGGNITITGGAIEAKSQESASIGGGFGLNQGGAGGNITITGGTVVATRIGGGNAGPSGTPGVPGTFSTGANGKAVIFASEICDQGEKNNWSGVIFEGNSGQVYGTSVTPVENFAIAIGNNLLVPEGSSLNISGISATNEGRVYVDGTLSGTITNNNSGAVYYPLTVNGCTASTTYTYGGKTYGKPGEIVTLTTSATPVEGEELTWTVTPEMDISSGSFTMPSNAVTITAAITPKTYQIAYNTNGGTFDSIPADTYTFRTGATLPTNIRKAGYTFEGWYDNSAFNGNPFTTIGTTETGDKTFWAKWNANFYTVKFDTDGGNSIADKTVQWQNTVLTNVTAPTKTGWEFLGWKYNDTDVNENTRYSGLGVADTVQYVQLKAQWKDVAAPVISGIVNGKTYCLTRTVTVTDNVGVVSVTVDGVAFTLDSNNQFVLSPKETPHTIIARDAAGNTSAEMSVTVNSEHEGGTATCTEQATCIHCGTKYGPFDRNKHNLEYIPAKGATVTATGNKEYWHCKDCGKYFSDANGTNSIALSDTVISKLPPSIINGSGQSLTAGEWKELAFRSNAAFADFVRVELDGHTVESSRYTVKEGSTIVSLKADYVRTLSAGEHTLGIVSTNGTATTPFTIHAPAASDNSQASPEGNVSASVNTPSANKNPLSVPPTGDDSPLGLWVVALIVSGVLLIILGVVIKNRRSKK